MKTALFGGAFDPVHNGHIEAARAAADRFELDRVLFVVSGRPPHKNAAAQGGYEDRYRMVELACRADPRFEASRLEAPGRARGGKTYSIDTVERVQAALKTGDRLFFLIGRDAFEDIRTWRRADDLLASVEFLVLPRPGGSLDKIPIPSSARVRCLEGLSNPISSTGIRGRVARAEPIGEMVPAAVARYIAGRDLYRG